MRRSILVLAMGAAALFSLHVEGAPPVVAQPAAPLAVSAADGSVDLQRVPALAKTRPANPTKITPTATQLVELETPAAYAAVPKMAKVSVAGKVASILCKADAVKFRWPLDGNAGQAWGTNNYTDLDPAGGGAKRDYKGAIGGLAINYDGHRGYDIDVGSFREMDQNKVAARAAAPGEVVEIREDQPDRNLSCTGSANYVAVRHINGFTSFYLHLKKNSVSVKKGDKVVAGQALGIVGSSGCSSWPHLHFEVHDCDDNWVEPAKLAMWQAQPETLEKSGVLDVFIRQGGYAPQSSQIAEMPPNPQTLPRGATFGIGISYLSRDGDEITVGAFTTAGAVKRVSYETTGRYGHRIAGVTTVDLPSSYSGPVYVSVFINGELKAIRLVTVN